MFMRASQWKGVELLTIDIHTHILPPEIPKFKDRFGYSGFIELHHHKNCCGADMVSDEGKFFRSIATNCYMPEPRIEECDKSQVDVQVLSTVPIMFSYWTKDQDGEYIAKFLNDHLVEMTQKFPKRFVSIGTLPMQAPALAVKELRRLKSLGVPGVEIGSHINDWNLDNPKLFPIYEALEDLGMCLFVHPWDMMGKNSMPKYWLPWLVGMPAETSLAICSMIFGGVFEKFKNLRVAFAHGGGSFPMTIGRIEHGFKVRPDLCAIENKINPKAYLGKFYLDSLVHDPEVLKYIVNLMGEDNIVLGTDYPFPLGELEPGALIRNSDFTLKTKEKLLGQNALKWLGLSGEQFIRSSK